MAMENNKPNIFVRIINNCFTIMVYLIFCIFLHMLSRFLYFFYMNDLASWNSFVETFKYPQDRWWSDLSYFTTTNIIKVALATGLVTIIGSFIVQSIIRYILGF